MSPRSRAAEPCVALGTAGPPAPPGSWSMRRGGSDISRRYEMKVANSLKSLKARHKDCRVVRRKGRVYVINKTQRKFKARQG